MYGRMSVISVNTITGNQ